MAAQLLAALLPACCSLETKMLLSTLKNGSCLPVIGRAASRTSARAAISERIVLRPTGRSNSTCSSVARLASLPDNRNLELKIVRCASSIAGSASSSAARQTGGSEVLQVLRLNMLQDNPGAVHQKRRKGRGVGSGRGKTCGRGHKGQKAKESIGPLFEGGQTPLYKLLPKRGFTNKRHKKEMAPLNLSTLQNYVDMGRVDASNVITLYEMLQAGIFKANGIKHGVKLLAQSPGDLKQPVTIQVSRASAAAIEAVEKAGGTITTVHYNRLALRQLLRPHKFEESGRVRQARPPPKWQPYYTSFKNRGYLNPVVQMRNWLTSRKEHQKAFEKSANDLV